MKAKWTTVFAIFAISSALAIAFFIGLTVSTLIQSQYPLLFIVAIVVAFTAWFGRGTDILSLIREWHKERVEEERRIRSIPKFIITHDEGSTQFVRDKRLFKREGYGLGKRKF